MNTVDNRVVSMEFDNKKFEDNIQTSIKSLKNLDESLLLKNASKGFSEAEQAAARVSLDPLAKAIDNINNKFSLFGTIADQTIRDIVHLVERCGKQIIDTFVLDPVKSGMKEYETQIESVQTILSNTKSKGTTIDQVNAALDELNHYADMTIYNFTEMTRNIGRFTSAGVDLDTSVTAIKGIANLAAVSGSTAAQTSNAMYQLSQALASGTVKLMDWNSIVNANMGGEVFQNALKETARVHGVEIDKMIKKEGSFRETLKKEWLTTDILTETLEKFTSTTEGLTQAEIERQRQMWKARGYTEEQIDAIFDLGKTATDAATKVKTFTQLFDTMKEAAQSGWTQTWEYIIGDFEEARSFFTMLSDEFQSVIGASADARNSVFKFWHDQGGRELLIGALQNVYSILKGIGQIANAAFRAIFPRTTGEQLVNLSQKIYDFTENLRSSLGFVNVFGDGVAKIAQNAYSVVNDAVDAISGAAGKAVKKNEANAEELYKNMPEWMQIWVKRAGSADLKRISNWRKSNRDKWYDYWEAVTGKDYSMEREAMDLYAKMPEWMQKWVDRTGSRDLERISNWRESNQKKWNEYWDVVERGNQSTETVSTGLEEVAKSAEEATEQVNPFVRILRGLFSVVGIVKTGLSALAKGGFKVLAALVKPTISVLVEAAATLGDWATSIYDSIKDGTALNNFFDKLVEKVTPVGEEIAEGTKSVIEFFKSFSLSEHVKNAIDTLKKLYSFFEKRGTAEDGLDAISGADMSVSDNGFLRIAEKIIEIVDKIKSVSSKMISVTGTAFSILGEAISGVIEHISEKGYLNKLLIRLANGLNKILDILDSVIGKVSEFFESLKTNQNGTSIKESIKKWLDEFQPMEKILDFLDYLTEGMADENMEIKKASMEGMEYSFDFDMVKDRIKTFGERIVSAFTWLGSIVRDSVSGFFGTDIGTVLEKIKGFLFAFAQLKLLFSGAYTIKRIGKSIDKFPDILSSFTEAISGAFSGSLSDVIDAFKKKNWAGNFKSIANSILKISLSIGVLVAALYIMAKLDPTALMASLGILALLAVGIVKFVKALSKLQSFNTDVRGIGVGLLALSAGVWIMVQAIKGLGKMKPEVLTKGLIGLFGVIGVLITFVKGVNGSVFKASAMSFVGLAVAVRILIGAIRSLGKMDLTILAKGLVALFVLMKSLSSSMNGLSSVKFTNGLGIVGIAIALKIAISAMKDISEMDVLDIAKSIGSILILMKGLKTVASVSSATKFGSSIGQLILIGGSLFAFVEAMKALKGVSAGRITAISLSFAAILGMVTLAASSFTNIGITGALTSAGSIMLFIGSIGAIGIAIGWLLDKFDQNNVLISKLERAGELMKAIGALIGNFIQGMFDPSGIGKTKETSTIGEKLTNVMNDLQPFFESLGNIDDSTIQGLSNLSSAMGSIGKVGFFEAISQFITGKSSFETFGESLTSLGTALGEFQNLDTVLDKKKIKNIVDASGLIVDFTKTIPDSSLFERWLGLTNLGVFAGDLTELAGGLSEYGQVAAQIDAIKIRDSAGALTALTTVAAAVPEEGLLEKKMGITDLDSFARSLIPLALGLSEYGPIAKVLDNEAIQNSAGSLTALGIAAQSVPEEGLLEKKMGITDLDSFARSLIPLVLCLSEYGPIAKVLDNEAIQNSAGSLAALGTAAQSVPEEGLLEKKMSITDLDSFARSLIPLATALKMYSETVTGINNLSILLSAVSLRAIAVVANAVPEASVFEKFLNLTDLDSFVETFPGLATSLSTFAENLSGLKNVGKVTEATQLLGAIIDVATKVPKEGFFTKLFNITDFQKFIDELGQLGPNLLSYTNSISGITQSDVERSTIGIDLIDKFITRMNEMELGKQGGILGELASWFTGDNTLNTYAAMMKDFADNMAGFASVINGPDDIEGALDNTQSILDKMKTFFGDAQNEGGTANFDYNVNAIIGFLDTITTTFDNYVIPFYECGNKLIKGLEDGMKAVSPSPDQLAAGFTAMSVNRVNRFYSAFYSAGRNIVSGVANGISDNSHLATSAASRLASKTLAKFNQVLDINSPSGEFENSGMYSIMGLAKGWTKYAYLIEDPVTNSANTILTIVDSMMDNLNNVINSDDWEPVIRPVFDMSNVNSGMSTINSLFGANRTLYGTVNTSGLTSRAQTISSAQPIQNGSGLGNRDVVSAINSLGLRLDDLSEKMSKLKVVTDTGVLVGQILPEMDYQLGRKVMWEERGRV